MARTLNPLSSEKASGSFGRVITFKPRRTITVVARKSAPSQPQTSAQVAARLNFAAVSQAWAGLTPSQVQAWADYAAAHPVTDSLGASVVLPAYDAFVKSSLTQHAAFGSQPPLPLPGNHAVDLASFSASFASPLQISWTWTLNASPPAGIVMVFWIQGPLANQNRALRQPEQRLAVRRPNQTSPYVLALTGGPGYYYSGIQVSCPGVYDRAVNWVGPLHIPF